MSFANRMRGVATKLLSKFDERQGDQKIILVKQGSQVFDPIKGGIVVTEGERVPLTGVAVPYGVGMINDTTIQAGDIQLSVTADVEPKHPDKVELDGKLFSIIDSSPIAYTGIEKNIMWRVQLRR